MNKILLAVSLFYLFLMSPVESSASASLISGRVVHVADGDTVTILKPDKQQIKVRLYGIDCPERKQPFGMQARKFTADMVAGKDVKINVIDTDRYGRSVALVILDNGDILNQLLIINGYAWVYTKFCKAFFCKQWKSDEQRASSLRKGLWREKQALEPWLWRKVYKKIK